MSRLTIHIMNDLGTSKPVIFDLMLKSGLLETALNVLLKVGPAYVLVG